ncbi:titin-like [Denticeps clupeoides]|uniref:titin-like n=1 Tax=Denticeps clupeoides TaxID=299321 RepID=UPI0010A485B9|nr:titin-like [Denticeps clupeoides]
MKIPLWASGLFLLLHSWCSRAETDMAETTTNHNVADTTIAGESNPPFENYNYAITDNVSIIIAPMEAVAEGKDHTLRCYVQNPSPAKSLTLKWYRGVTELKNETFDRPSLNVSLDLVITPRTADSGEHYQCKAEIYLGSGRYEEHTVTLSLVVYKIPDSVSITPVNHTGVMFEGKEYRLQCDIRDIAPAQYVTVRWYEKDALLKTYTFNETEIRPVNLSSTLVISPKEADYGIQYRCEAELNLGRLGPHPPPKVSSDNFTVICGCPVEIQPPTVVVEFGKPAAANCTALVPIYGIGWESSHGSVGLKERVPNLLWNVTEMRLWDLQPMCFINALEQCSKLLNVVVYKIPDNVSITPVNHTGGMVEGREYHLQCDITGIAPVQNVTVRWYKGETSLKNDTFNDSSRTPVNTSSTVTISPTRADDMAKYRCEAELNLGLQGPRPAPKVVSDFIITLLTAPVFLEQNVTLHADRGKTITLECRVNGSTPLQLQWQFKGNQIGNATRGRHSNLSIEALSQDKAGEYTCVATNTYGRARRTYTLLISDPQMNWIVLALCVVFVSLIVSVILVFFYKYRKGRIGYYEIFSDIQLQRNEVRS